MCFLGKVINETMDFIETNTSCDGSPEYTVNFLCTWLWFTIQQSQVLSTDGWLNYRQCVVLHRYVVYQKTQQSLIHK